MNEEQLKEFAKRAEELRNRAGEIARQLQESKRDGQKAREILYDVDKAIVLVGQVHGTLTKLERELSQEVQDKLNG